MRPFETENEDDGYEPEELASSVDWDAAIEEASAIEEMNAALGGARPLEEPKGVPGEDYWTEKRPDEIEPQRLPFDGTPGVPLLPTDERREQPIQNFFDKPDEGAGLVSPPYGTMGLVLGIFAILCSIVATLLDLSALFQLPIGLLAAFGVFSSFTVMRTSQKINAIEAERDSGRGFSLGGPLSGLFVALLALIVVAIGVVIA